MQLSTSVFTANRGYAWSNVPDGLSVDTLNRLYRYVSEARGDFPDPMMVEVGLVSDGNMVAIYTIQNVEKWDSEKRASDYAAFAFFSVSQAKDIDFVSLLHADFFWTPSHNPASVIEYEGTGSESYPPELVDQLKKNHVATIGNPRGIGALISKYGKRSNRWTCRLYEKNILEINCNAWNRK